MQRFAIKIDKSVKARLKTLCRLCGIGNPNQIDILNAAEWIDLTIEGEVSLSRKIAECVGIQVIKNDRMPQRICALCVDKINDFYEFREMCEATQIQTRKLLNLPDPAKVRPPKKVTIKTDVEENVESIFGIVDTDVKTKTEPVQKPPKKTKKTTGSTSTTTSENRFKGMTKREIEITLELERIKQEEEQEEQEKKIAENRTKNGKKKKQSTADLLAPKAPNQRERKREIEQKRIEKKRKAETKIKAPSKKKIKKEPGVSCLVCEERFEKISFRDAHMVASHRPMTVEYGCSSCLEQFTTIEENTSHHDWHTMYSVPHKCVMCGATFEKLITFQRHLSACIHPFYTSMNSFSNSINCELCNQEFATQNLYDWHNCFIGANSPCPTCQRVFIKKTVLMKHFFKCTGPGPFPIEMTEKAGPKSKKHKQFGKSRNEISPQNSFKLEPETIIESVGDAYDNDDVDMDNSYMDTHFGDSDNEFDGINNSIMTSIGSTAIETTLPIIEQVTSAPSCSTAKKSTTCTNLGMNKNIRTNSSQSLLECRVKLEPLDMSSFNTSFLSINAEPAVEKEPSQPPQPPPTVPPLVISRPIVPPLTIRIKKEVIRPGYGDGFDTNLARNIKKERFDETYELASTSQRTQPHSVSHKKSSSRKREEKEKKLYKKPALLAIKIKQERMEREDNENETYYPDYSMPSEDFIGTTMPTSQAPFDNNTLPIITQIHSVLEPPVINPMAYSAPQLNPFATMLTNQQTATTNMIPLTPIRIKSEFQTPLTPPSIDDVENFNQIDTNNLTSIISGNATLTDNIIPVQNIKKEIQSENEPNQEANNECEKNSSLHEFDNLNLQSNSIDNVAATDSIGSNELASNIDTVQPASSSTDITANEQSPECMDQNTVVQWQNEIEDQLKSDSNEILPRIDAKMQIETSSSCSFLDQNYSQTENSENNASEAKIESHENVPASNEVPPNENTNDKNDENEIREQEKATVDDNQYIENNANIIGTCQQANKITEATTEIESISNAVKDDENVIKSIDDNDLDVVATHENIPTDFNEQNANDDSLNFIEQLVHEAADKMVPESTNMQFDVDRIANFGGSSQHIDVDAESLVEVAGESNEKSIEKSTINEDILLTDMPEIDYNDLLSEISTTESNLNGDEIATPIQPVIESDPNPTENAELPI